MTTISPLTTVADFPSLGRSHAAHVFQAVLHPQLQTRIVERAAMHHVKIGASELDHFLVELHQHHLLHRAVLEEFLGRTAVAAADDERRTRPRMREPRHMDEILVIDEFIGLARHRAAIKAEHAPE